MVTWPFSLPKPAEVSRTVCEAPNAVFSLTSKARNLTGHLVPSERHLHGADVVVVDEAGPRLQVRSYAVGSRNVPAGGDENTSQNRTLRAT